MAQLIDFCADQESWRGWSALRQLDFAADERRLQRWLVGVLTKEPPQKSIKAYWFGIFNPIVEDKAKGSVSVYGAYVLCLGFGGLIIKTLANTIDVETWLGNVNSRAIAIGFDSGDGILLGSITKNGWQPSAAKIG
jgi:hypothetical protein